MSVSAIVPAVPGFCSYAGYAALVVTASGIIVVVMKPNAHVCVDHRR